jgi:ornithine--oxo-acid transaminase
METTVAPSDRSAAELIALEERYGAANYAPLDVVIARAEGVYAWDVDGNRYIDCISAYSAVNQGHCHPKIRAALVEQSARLTLTSRAVRNDRLGPFLEELTAYCDQEMALVMNTGVEAVETAIKLARRWGYRRKHIAPNAARILVSAANFHGRTTTAVSASDDPQTRADYGPFTPGFTVLPFGDLEALRAAISAPDVCAFLIEPVQGEGGVNVPPEGYLRAARALCGEHNVLFVADEIQTGFGRTGARFALDHDGIKPDVLIVGKALGGGYYPVSAALAKRDLLGLFGPGDHGSTFGGNPLACQVASAALRVIVDEGLAENARVRGEQLKSRLRGLADPRIRDVRGRGLLIGIELDRSGKGLTKALLRNGLLVKDTHDRILRVAPPLVITERQIGEIASAFEKALASDW